MTKYRTIEERMKEYNTMVKKAYTYKSVNSFRRLLHKNCKKGEMPLLRIDYHKTKSGEYVLFNFPQTKGV